MQTSADVPRLLPFTHRDRRFEGIATVLIGSFVVAAGTAFAVVGLAAGGAGVALFGCVTVGAGFVAMRREVRLGADGLLVVTPVSRTDISMETITGIRIRQRPGRPGLPQPTQQHLVVRSAGRQTVTLHAPNPQSGAALQEWLDLACSSLQKRWAQELAGGSAVSVSRRVKLQGSVLTQGTKQMDLSLPFEIREVPATGYAAGLMSLQAEGRSIILDAGDANYPALRRLILEHRSRAATKA